MILCAVFLSGCGRDQYSIERDYWKVNRQAQFVLKNPVATPPNEIQRVVSLLSNFAAGHEKNTLAVRAEFLIGRIYLAKGMYDQARGQYNAIASKYSKSAAVVSEALFFTGSSYQLQNNEDAAIAQYRQIIDKYPLSPRGLQMPIYIAKYYSGSHEPVKMQEAYRAAIAHYESLAQKDAKSALALRACTLVAECYAGLKDWHQAIAALETIVTNFKDRGAVDGVLLNIAVIYQRELRDPPKAKEVLARLIKDYPDSKYANAARELLKK